MQTDIKIAQAFGMIGEMYDLTPRRVDAFETANDIYIGDVVCRKSDGTLGAYESSVYTGFAGICVRAKESINYGATTALSPSLKIPEGVTAQVASMGRIIVPIELSASSTTSATAAKTDLETLAAVSDGATLYFKDGKLTPTSTSATTVGKFFKGCTKDDLYSVAETSSTSGSTTTYTAKGYVNVVIEIG